MPTLIGELEKITGSPSSVTQVMVRAHETRITGSALTTDELVPIPVDRQGRFEVPLRPGKAVLVLVHGGRVGEGERFPMLVEEGLGTIVSAIKLASDRFDDYELDELERAAADMLASLDRGLVAATRAEVAQEGAQNAKKGSEDARDKAGEHRDDAKKAAGTAATDAVQKADEKLAGYVTAAGGSATSAGNDARRAETARQGAETIQQNLPTKVEEELDAQLPGKLDTRVPAELDKHLPGELDERVPPLVAESIADDRAVADAAAAAVSGAAEGMDLMERSTAEEADQALSGRISAIEPIQAEEVSDTAWAHTTENGTRLPLGYSSDGHLDAHARTTFRADVMQITEQRDDQDHAYVMTTDDGKLLMAFRQDGTVTIPGLDGESSGGSAREKYRHTDGTLAPVMADTTQIAGWGSSSMLGMAPEITAALDGLPATYTNYAQGGELIEHNAARMGVEPAIIDPVTVPESGAVTVTSPNLPFNTFMLPYTGHLGGVHGTLAPVSGSFRFTRTASGDVLTLPAPTEFIPDIDPHLMERTQIFQLGKNNLWQGDAVSNVSRLTDKIIQSLRPLHVRVLLLGHHWNRGYDPGHTTHLRVSGMSEHMRKIAGEDCFIDVHAITTGQEIWERTGLTPTAQDLADQEAGILPASLAADNTHFNESMDRAMAQIIRERIDYLGWY